MEVVGRQPKFEAQLRAFGREIVPKEVMLGKVIGVGTRYDIHLLNLCAVIGHFVNADAA